MRCSVVIVLTVVLVSVVAGCSPGVPKEYIQPDEMEDILYDYFLSQALAVQVTTDKRATYEKNAYYHAVLKKHGITEAEFDSSLVYYYTHAEDFEKIYKNVVKRMEGEAMKMGATVSAVAEYEYEYDDENGDTTNIWHEGRSAILMPIAPYNRLDFAFECDSTYMLGDSFLMTFSTSFVYQSGTKDGIVLIAVHYEGDSIKVFSTNIKSSGDVRLRIDMNKKYRPQSIKGFIYLSKGNDESMTQKLLFIDRIRLLRYHPLVPIEVEPDTIAADTAVADTLANDSLMKFTFSMDSIKQDSATTKTPVKAKTKKSKTPTKKTTSTEKTTSTTKTNSTKKTTSTTKKKENTTTKSNTTKTNAAQSRSTRSNKEER